MPPSETSLTLGTDPLLHTGGPAVRTAGEVRYDVLAEAFEDDPFIRWMFPEEERYRRAFVPLARAFGNPASANGTADSDQRGLAAALWLPPKTEPSTGTLISVALREVAARRWATLSLILLAMLRAKPREPHWYLAMVGTRAEARGQGLGSALLEERLARCDAEGRAAYLEATSPRNVTLYERLGFRRLKPIVVGDSPPLLPMIRPPTGWRKI